LEQELLFRHNLFSVVLKDLKVIQIFFFVFKKLIYIDLLHQEKSRCFKNGHFLSCCFIKENEKFFNRQDSLPKNFLKLAD